MSKLHPQGEHSMQGRLYIWCSINGIMWPKGHSHYYIILYANLNMKGPHATQNLEYDSSELENWGALEGGEQGHPQLFACKESSPGPEREGRFESPVVFRASEASPLVCDLC